MTLFRAKNDIMIQIDILKYIYLFLYIYKKDFSQKKMFTYLY